MSTFSASTFGIATAFIVACMSHCLYVCCYGLQGSITNKEDESFLEILGTVYLSLQTLGSVIFVAIRSFYLIGYQTRMTTTIEYLKSIKEKLDGCSDELTQIYSPGPIEYLEESQVHDGVFVLCYMYVLIWCILVLSYGLFQGIYRYTEWKKKEAEEAKDRKLKRDKKNQPQLVPNDSRVDDTVANTTGQISFS